MFMESWIQGASCKVNVKPETIQNSNSFLNCFSDGKEHEISNTVVGAISKASGQPAHTYSLIRAFASRLHILGVLSYWPNIILSF